MYSKEKDTNEKFRLAKVFQNGIVLQRAPERANIFGFAPLGTFVTVTIIKNGERHDMGNVTVAVESCLKGTWSLNIGAWEAGSDYSIEITNSGQGIQTQTILLESVSFGEVWFCAGQSNMEQQLNTGYELRNRTAEIEKAKTYNNIKLLYVIGTKQKELHYDRDYRLNWVEPAVGLVDYQFSAICMIFGELLYDELKVPIGLIDSTFGGTALEEWSPPGALKKCGLIDESDAGVLWNSMIHPLLKMTIKGVIWYQGENNAGYPGDYHGRNRDHYGCMFTRFIEAWRKESFVKTGNGTIEEFPFGFVQLAAWHIGGLNLAWPKLRWQQTTRHGQVPNKHQPNVFMATAIDSDHDLHPQSKRPTATRLYWAALNIAYGQSEKPLQSPYVTNITVNDKNNLIATFSTDVALKETRDKDPVHSEVEREPIRESFSVCCLENTEECDSDTYLTYVQPISSTNTLVYGQGWKSVQIERQINSRSVEISTDNVCGEQKNVTSVAVGWRESPCLEEECQLTSADKYKLPLLPMKMDIGKGIYF